MPGTGLLLDRREVFRAYLFHKGVDGLCTFGVLSQDGVDNTFEFQACMFVGGFWSIEEFPKKFQES